MMSRRMQASLKVILGVAVAFGTLVPNLRAQDTTATTTATGTTAAGPQNLAGFLLPSAKQLAALKAMCSSCKEKICSCCVGQLLSSMTMPLSLMTGGCIKPCCPPVKAADLKSPADSAAGACARITKDAMEMEQRRKSVRCLARADCNWFPEAELALISSLRTDRAECVRLEAARVLSVGCCGTKKIIDSLTICVNANSKDGNPPENSPRVREMALVALQHALECYVEREEPQRPELPGSMPAPKPLPEKMPAAPPAEKPPVRPASALADDEMSVIQAAIQTLKQTQGGAGEVTGAAPAQVADQAVQVQPGTKGVAKVSEPSAAVLSRAMLAVREGKAKQQQNPENCHVLGKGQRNVVGIFSQALRGSSARSNDGGANGGESLGMKGGINSNPVGLEPAGSGLK